MYQNEQRAGAEMKKKKKSRRNKLLFAILFMLLFFILFRLERAVKPVISIQAEQYSKMTASEIIDEAVSDYLSKNKYTYNDFSKVLYDENGKAVSIEAVTYTINKAQSELNTSVSNKIKKIGENSVDLYLGSLSDSYLLVGKGPKLKLKICPVGSAEISINSELSSVGINQTKHRISAEIELEMSSSTPLYSFKTKTKFEFILAETVIFGEVPQLIPADIL